LPHALPHHSVAACAGFALIHAVLLRLLKLLHVCGVGIVLSVSDYTAANENGCGGCYQEKMPFHQSLLTAIGHVADIELDPRDIDPKP
jgi:hypothetical protein